MTERVRDLSIGLIGTKFAFVFANLDTAAAVAAGFATAVWMATQTVLAILKHRRK